MRVLLLIVLLSLSMVSVLAQDSWPVVERCMGDLTYPLVQRDNWDFPGIIVSSAFPDGIHAIRGDMQVEYYIAFQSDQSFASAGALSPDGQYYAYPTGYIIPNVTITEDEVVGESVRIVRTDGNTNETYRFEIESYSKQVFPGEDSHLPGPEWFGPDLIYYPSGFNTYYYKPRKTPLTVLYRFRSGEGIYWTPSTNPYYVSFVSPDATRAFYRTPDRDSPGNPDPHNLDRPLYDLENDTLLAYSAAPSSRNGWEWNITWFADSSAFAIVDKEGITTIVDRDGNVLETIPIPNVIEVEVAPNGTLLALWGWNAGVFLVDIQRKTIVDLCFQGEEEEFKLYDNLAWSPDSRSLAFSYDKHLVILDTQTLENQVIDHYSRRVLAWVPLPGETTD